MDAALRAIFQQPGLFRFPSNEPYAPDPEAAGGRVRRLETGHFVVDDRAGRRILALDPGGTPLHECDWTGEGAASRLARARVYLDWGRWVGLRPEGIVHTTVLDLSRKPGWERLRPDDLRRMAAQALQVSLEDIRFFYAEPDLVIDRQGRATIRHKKDALYVLQDGTFDSARFMACMGAMHWTRIDFLPVVELFQSLLPGTGSAVFELIRGLYDDQHTGRPPTPLQYRGIPVYPSEAAFRLFSAFFTPAAPAGTDPLTLFMDPRQAHHVRWLPSAVAPRRYFAPDRRLCVTVRGEHLQKVSVADDPAGLPFNAPSPGRPTPGDRTARIADGRLLLRDGTDQREVAVDPAWGPLRPAPPDSPAPVGWRTVFPDGSPKVPPSDAWGAVLLYPDDETEIDEIASQPFVADHLQDLVEHDPNIGQRYARARHVLICNGDAVVTTCLQWDQPRRYTVRYRDPVFAQRQAQLLWYQLAVAHALDRLPSIRFLPGDDLEPGPYDLAALWLPFALFERPESLRERLRTLARVLGPGALAFVVGPATLAATATAEGLRPELVQPVEDLPPFQMHRSILPKARLRPGLTLYQLTRS